MGVYAYVSLCAHTCMFAYVRVSVHAFMCVCVHVSTSKK